MKKKVLSALLCAAMTATMLAGCGNQAADTSTNDAADNGQTTATESSAPADTAASGDLIKVGIINNDPNESGYRTANDKDMKAMFTEENGYDASFAYSLKNDEQITAAQKFIQDGVDYLLLSAADTAGWDSVLQDAQDAQGTDTTDNATDDTTNIEDQDTPLANQDLKDLDDQDVPKSNTSLDSKEVKKGLPLAAGVGIGTAAVAALAAGAVILKKRVRR